MLGEHLRKIREVQGMLRMFVAVGAKCSSEQVRRVEQGESRPSPELLARMLRRLGATPKEQQRAWVYLAQEMLPDKIRQHVEVHPPRVYGRAADAAVEWVKQNLELPEGEERFLRAHIEQRLKT